MYDIIFWDNLSFSIKIFRIKKKITRIITNSRNRDSCKDLKDENTTFMFTIHIYYVIILSE